MNEMSANLYLHFTYTHMCITHLFIQVVMQMELRHDDTDSSATTPSTSSRTVLTNLLAEFNNLERLSIFQLDERSLLPDM